MSRGLAAGILAGGRARRLGGIDKPRIAIDGRTIFARQLDVLAPRVDEVLVAIAPGAAPLAVPPRWHDRVRFVVDDVADAGPLAGVAALLAAARGSWLMVVAGDLPWLDGAAIDLLLAEVAAAGDAADAVAARVGGLPEPLWAAYATRVAPVAARRIAAGRRKASGLLTDEGLRVRWLEEAALRAVDPELRGLRDIDTPSDLPPEAADALPSRRACDLPEP